MKLDSRGLIAKAKFRMYKEQPFFSYILDSLAIEENPQVSTMGVTPKLQLLYAPQFVEGLKLEELIGVLAHEVLHVAYNHIGRVKSRNSRIWNVAADVVINNILLREKFVLPKNGLLPKDDSIRIGGITISDISSKSAEMIYNELIKGREKRQKGQQSQKSKQGQQDQQGQRGQQGQQGQEDQEGGDEMFPSPVDNHDHWGEESIGEREKAADEIKKIVDAAVTHARMRGQVPGEIERIVQDFHRNKVPWRVLLRQYVQSHIKTDYTWARPNKKYMWSDLIMPALHGEEINVLIHIDTSGSIDGNDLKDFLSEIAGMAHEFPCMKCRVLAGDTDIRNDVTISSIQDIKKLKLKGGGGTSHIPVFEYAKKFRSRHPLLVAFTDGFTEWPKKPTIPTIIVLSKGGSPDLPTWAKKVIRLE